MNLSDIVKAMQFTLSAPRQGARLVMNWKISTTEGWLALALAAIISTLLAELLSQLIPGQIEPAMAAVLSTPMEFAALQFLGLSLITLIMFAFGRQFGGKGSFAETVSVVAWLQAILLVIQTAQIVTLLVLPVLSFFIGIGGLALTIWLVVNFAAELHGFRSLLKTFIGMIAAFIIVVIVLSLILIFVFGIGVPNV